MWAMVSLKTFLGGGINLKHLGILETSSERARIPSTLNINVSTISNRTSPS